MDFEIVGQITDVETIAEGNGIRELGLLRQRYGLGNWRKKKGVANVRLPSGLTGLAEIHPVGQVLIEEGRRQQQEQRQERAEKQQQQPERPRRAARIG